MYNLMSLDSGWKTFRKKGGQWKGRHYTPGSWTRHSESQTKAFEIEIEIEIEIEKKRKELEKQATIHVSDPVRVGYTKRASKG